MKRALLMQIGDDVPLRSSRSAILSSAFDVIDCCSRDALEMFMAQPNVDAVVICGSVERTMQELLVARFRHDSPRTLILQIGNELHMQIANTVLIDPHAPHKLVAAIARAFAEHARGAYSSDPSADAPERPANSRAQAR